jgi:aminoglycoside 3-N-acetyltransferase
VLDGLLREGCTVLVPTFSLSFDARPPAGRVHARNGYSRDGSLPDPAQGYSPELNEVLRNMGAIPAAVLATPGRARGHHPLNSFAAVGPMARQLVQDQAPLWVYAPLEALIEAGGSVIMMGVYLQRLTLLHLAEQRGGRTLFRRWAATADRGIIEVEVGSCSKGFDRLGPVLDPITRETAVGASRWRVLSAGPAVDRAAAAVRADPSITHCPDPDCQLCNDAAAGGPLLTDQL